MNGTHACFRKNLNQSKHEISAVQFVSMMKYALAYPSQFCLMNATDIVAADFKYIALFLSILHVIFSISLFISMLSK